MMDQVLAHPEDVIVEVQDMHKDYGGVRAVNGLNLSVRKNDIHCIIGPNGAGKSTLFKLLMGIERPTAGRVLYKNRDITSLPPFRRARLGLTIKFQNIRVYQDLTVFQNLFIPLRRHHQPADIPDRVAALLDRLHLTGTANTPVRNLSHGQQQWLSIGLSLAVDPELLLLDEPTAGMSVEETAETTRIVYSLRAHGVTVIVIEHDMEFVRNLAAVTSVLHLGRLFAQGSFAEIEANEDVRRIYLGTL
jgi:ABC-type branched-subunit amino acid transport system ATPase component